MVFSCSSSSTTAFFAAMCFMALMSTTPSSAFDLNKDICSNSDVLNSSFCEKFLSSNTVVIKSFLHGLVDATIDVALSNATQTRQQIPKWIKHTADRRVKSAILNCATPYSNAIAALEDARELVRSGDNGTVLQGYAVAAADLAALSFQQCEVEFAGLPLGSLPLDKTSSELATISSILLAVFEFLGE